MTAGIRISPEVITKTPEEVLRKPMSFVGNDLPTGETIASVDSVTVVPTGDPNDLLAPGVPAGTSIILTLSKGRAAVDYFAIALVTTSAGQKLQQVGRIRVDNAS